MAAAGRRDKQRPKERRSGIETVALRSALACRLPRDAFRVAGPRPSPTPLGFRFAGTENFFRQDWEVEQRRIIGREPKTAEILIDVGANQGIYSCLAASLGKVVVAVATRGYQALRLRSLSFAYLAGSAAAAV